MRAKRHIFRWDLDKTYLATDFDSLGSLVKIAFEKADQKVNVPGAASLLRQLTRATEDAEWEAHVHFISGSPQQMAGVLAEKLKLDGITYHSLNLKPNLRNLTRGRFRAIKEQVGYKLPLLLKGRADYGPGEMETLFGDDAESDGFIYALYADLMAQRIDWDTVLGVFEACRVYPDTLEMAKAARDHLQFDDCVEQIFINLDRRSNPNRFAGIHERIVPIYNYWQAALVMEARGRLSAGGALAVAETMISSFGSSVARLRNSAEDLLRRRQLSVEGLALVNEALANAEPEWNHRPLVKALSRLISRPPPVDAPPPPAADEPRDYVALFHQEKAARKQAKEEVIKARRA